MKISPVQENGHVPVMLAEVLEALKPHDGEVYIDGTFGAGGYTRAILEEASCKVVAIDRDPDAKDRASGFEETYGDRFLFLSGCFGDMRDLLKETPHEKVDGIVLDIGVSSFQIDDPARGFSFRFDGPLDMRMSKDGVSAADIVNTYAQDDLAHLIWKYGDERKSRRIASRIIEARAEHPIETTGQLADLVRSVVPKSFKDKSDPATRTFQALRIAVNDELKELESALLAAEYLLKPGGRLVVVAFHSLEDTIVKTFLYERCGKKSGGSRHLPQQDNQILPSFELSPRKPIKPTSQEEVQNKRARSAVLRGAVRTDAPVYEAVS
jgi:16S rRNA (cytosine1402-N4)-methyltransferase